MSSTEGSDPSSYPDGAPRADFNAVLNEAPWFRSNLPRYKRWESVSLLAGLLTRPDCLANTVRLEAMVHLCVALANGQMAPRRDDLIVWFNRHFWKTHLRLMEDPLEDVFISNICDGSGNHRIFEGIWEENAYWLQSLISATSRLPDEAKYLGMRRSMRALLDLSEAVAKRNHLARYSEGGGEDKGRIPFPNRDELENLAANVIFSEDELVSLGITIEYLTPFFWSDAENESILTAENDDSPLQRRPILKKENSYLLALPAAVSIAIRRFVLETVESHGDLTTLDHLVCNGQARELIDDGLTSLGGSPLKIEEVREGKVRPPVSFALCPFKFDLDKFGVLCLINPPLKDALRLGFWQIADHQDKWKPVDDEIRRMTETVSKTPGFRFGMCVFAIGGLGARFGVPMVELPKPWLTVSYSVPKLITLTGVEDVDFLMIWRLAAQEEKARSQGIEFLNPNGDFNQLANWRSAKFSLIPDDMSTDDGRHNLIHMPVNGLLELRLEARRRSDIHAAFRRCPSRWIIVERKDPHSPFRQSRTEPLYVARHLAKKGELVAVVDVPGATWWISATAKPKTAWQLSLVYQLWDCIGHWLIGVAQALAKRHPTEELVSEFIIDFPGINEWKEIGRLGSETTGAKLEWEFIGDQRIKLSVGEQFMPMFGQASNVAEREIVATLLAAGTAILGERTAPEEIDSMRDSIIPLGNARQFHLTIANDASFASEPGPIHSYEVRPEVISEIVQDLGRAVAPSLLGTRTNDTMEIRRLIRAAVVHLREAMTQKLAPISLKSITSSCLDVLNTLHRDSRRWEMSAAALLAIHPDRDEILAEAHRQESRRSGASSAARIVIETALYSCHGGTEDVPESTLDELLGLAQVLLRIADYDPPAVEKIPAGEMTLSKSGALYVRNDFLDKLRQDYHRTGFEEGFFSAARSYARHYRNEAERSPPGDLGMFDAALTCELGVDSEQAYRIGEALNHVAGARHQAVLLIRRSELESLLVTEANIFANQATLFFNSLNLFPRQAWDRDLPDGCEKTDVYPWRFKRKLSLLRRPIIQLDLGADPELQVSPVLIRDGVHYFVSNSYEGNFPQSFFRTLEMRSFQDHAIARRSADFVRQTADIFKQAGYQAETKVLMPRLGGSSDLGDVDVLAWRCGKLSEVWAVECKAMRNARSTADVLSQLDQFKGDVGDLLSKHLKRTKWLDENRTNLTGMTAMHEFTLRGAVVTSHLVPMQFLPRADVRFGEFIDAELLRKRLSSR